MKPYHGELDNLYPNESLSLLEEKQFAHLACHAGHEIYLVPISYVYSDQSIYSHSKPGRKIDLMRKNPKVCLQVEDIKDFFHWKSVIVWGRYEELKGDQANRAMRLLLQKFREQNKRHSSLELDFSAQLESAIIYQIHIEKMTSRSEGQATEEPMVVEASF